MKKIVVSVGVAALVAAAVVLGVSGSTPHRSNALNTPIVDGVHTGQFGANSKVADPKPGPAMISPDLKLAAYDTAVGTSVPTSEYISASSNPLPGGTTMEDPSISQAALPEISQQDAVKLAAEQGFPEASTSSVQPTAYYGILTNSVVQTVPLPAGESLGDLNPTVLGQEYSAGEGVLKFVNVPTWVVEWTVPVPLANGVSKSPIAPSVEPAPTGGFPANGVSPTPAPTGGFPANGVSPAPALSPVTTTTVAAPATTTLYIFINADTGAYMYG